MVPKNEYPNNKIGQISKLQQKLIYYSVNSNEGD